MPLALGGLLRDLHLLRLRARVATRAPVMHRMTCGLSSNGSNAGPYIMAPIAIGIGRIRL